jgi:iron complex transport system ATP-binding protein
MRIEIRNISYSYDKDCALIDASADIGSGSLTGIIGPNGSGKSTLLRILGAIVKPGSGSVLYGGKAISSMPPTQRARIVGAVLQDEGAQFGYTVSEVVEMGRFPYRGLFGRPDPSGADAVLAAMEKTGAIELANRPITALSSGERQRAYIARALAQEPKVLLLDEPTSHLDISFQLEIMELLKKLAASGTTVVIVMHDLNLAGLYCDFLIAMKDGRVVAEGEPDAVLTAENIMEIYGVKAVVENHPATSRPVIITMSQSKGR